MSENVIDVDVVVVGAGVIGAGAAFMLAREGRTVALLDRLAFDRAGAGWVNGIPPEAYDWAGVERPETPERVLPNFPISIAINGHDEVIHIPLGPMWNIDMRRMTGSFQTRAEAAGVQVFERMAAGKLEYENGRPVALHARPSERSDAKDERIFRAKLFVDAAGMAGVLRKQDPVLGECCPAVADTDICTAMQEECEVSDPNGARAFCERYGVEPGTMVDIVGIAGGWSTECIHVAPDLKSVSLLCGCIKDGLRPTGPQLMRDLKRRHASWLGRATHSGAGLIPLRRPYDRFVSDGIAALGDAACTVFPLHGSGIKSGLAAGSMLAKAVGRADDPGDLETLWTFQARFMHEFGPIHGYYDLLRRLSQGFDHKRLIEMFEGGLMSRSLSEPGIAQRIAGLPLGEVPKTILGGLTHPGLMAAAFPKLLRMPLAIALYKRYPDTPDMRALRRWSSMAGRLFGSLPEIR